MSQGAKCPLLPCGAVARGLFRLILFPHGVEWRGGMLACEAHKGERVEGGEQHGHSHSHGRSMQSVSLGRICCCPLLCPIPRCCDCAVLRPWAFLIWPSSERQRTPIHLRLAFSHVSRIVRVSDPFIIIHELPSPLRDAFRPSRFRARRRVCVCVK